MNEIAIATVDRSRLLRSKKDELRSVNQLFPPAHRSRINVRINLRSNDTDICSEIVKSRKRKLRELYAVCQSEEPLPQVNLSDDTPPGSAEARFLEVSDILKYVMPIDISRFRIFETVLRLVLDILLSCLQGQPLQRSQPSLSTTVEIRHLKTKLVNSQGKL